MAALSKFPARIRWYSRVTWTPALRTARPACCCSIPPTSVIANGSGDSIDDGDASTTSFSGAPSGTTGTVITTDNPGGGTLTLFESELEGIAATTNISLAATNAITINDLADNNLNLAQTAGNSVSFNSATFAMAASDRITTAGGAVNITTTGAATVAGLSTGGGAIVLDVGGASTVSGVIAGTGTTLTKPERARWF
jgi:hypothetical protein